MRERDILRRAVGADILRRVWIKTEEEKAGSSGKAPWQKWSLKLDSPKKSIGCRLNIKGGKAFWPGGAASAKRWGRAQYRISVGREIRR